MGSNRKIIHGEVVDLFCGVGGISHGFLKAGFDIRAGFDLDSSCEYAYKANNNAEFICKDLANVTAKEISSYYSGNKPTVLVGCAPCQPFSTYKKAQSDSRWNLVQNFAHLANDVDADFVTMENVAGLVNYKEGKIFNDFLETLSQNYEVSYQVVNCSDYGVPQSRRRLVVIGSKKSKISLSPNKTNAAISVKEAIGNLPSLNSGEISPDDALHRCSKLSELNLKRIKHSKQGGTWRDWPKDMVAKCHQKKKGRGYSSVYGRMRWDAPAPTMTTQCYGFGNGRFGHPDQDRAISLREAAILQSFPENYKFFTGNKFPGFKTTGRWIGNAVPVALATHIANSIIEHINE